MKTQMYNANETMKLIGKQSADKILTKEALKGISEIVKANKEYNANHYLIDAYILGFIEGEKRKKTCQK